MDGNDDTIEQLGELIRRAEKKLLGPPKDVYRDDPTRHPGSKPPLNRAERRRRAKRAKAARRSNR